MDDNLPELLPEEFGFLVTELGFRVVSSERQPSAFSTFVALTNDLMNVLVSRDLGWVGAEVSGPSAPERWLPLEHIMKIALCLDPTDDPSTKVQAEFLRSHTQRIVEMVSACNLERTYAEVLLVGQQRLELRRGNAE